MRNTKQLKIIVLLGILLIWAAQSACARQAVRDQPDARSRVMPPEILACDRNQLTSYNGQVIEYRRGEGSISIRIRTEWGSVEDVSLEYEEIQGAIALFLIDGRAFTEADWPKIESRQGVLIKEMHVIAWVCLDDLTPPVLDWRPR